MAGSHSTGNLLQPMLPDSQIQRWTQPIRRFVAIESSSGLLLIVCTCIALGLANSPLKEQFAEFWHLPCFIGVGDWYLKKDLLHVVNDGLMTIFFFVIGLEIKREIVAGELRDPRQAILPVVAAIGGMVAPALVFLGLRGILGIDASASRGWAIPMATDIAFVVGILALFGNRVPYALRVLLLTLAIVDDLGAILIIAFVFTETLLWLALGIAGLGLLLTWWLNRIGVRNVGVYTLVGAVVWICVLKAGIHPTIAGVILGLMTPAQAWVGTPALDAILNSMHGHLQEHGNGESSDHAGDLSPGMMQHAQFAVKESVSPLERLEHLLHPWMAFGIMPIFALANAGVEIQLSALTEPIAVAIAAGLLIGKPVGILACCGITVWLGWAQLPRGVNWGEMAGGAALAGIGFTMSLFLAGLALPAELLDAGKIGTLSGSLLSTLLGVVLLWLFCATKEQAAQEAL